MKSVLESVLNASVLRLYTDYETNVKLYFSNKIFSVRDENNLIFSVY